MSAPGTEPRTLEALWERLGVDPNTGCRWDVDADGFRVCETRRGLRRAAAIARAEGQMAAYRVYLRRLFEHHCTSPAGDETPTALRADSESDQGSLVPAGDHTDATQRGRDPVAELRRKTEAGRSPHGSPGRSRAMARRDDCSVTPEDIDRQIAHLISTAERRRGGLDAAVECRQAERALKDMIEDYAEQRRSR